MPFVSVILPVYNAEPYLAQAVQSIMNQTLDDWELIIADDGSTDRSIEIAYGFSDPRIHVWAQEKNCGYPTAMNMGLHMANGKYIARMDADDVSAPERLYKQVALLESTDDYVFVASRRYWLTPNDKRIDPDPMKKQLVVETWDDLMNGSRLFTDASVVVERRLVEQVGGYRTYQRSGQDVDLWLRLLELGRPMGTLTEPLYGRRLLPSALTFQPQTKSSNRIPRQLAQERCKTGTDAVIRGEAIKPIDDDSADTVKNIKHWRIAALWKSGLECMRAGDYKGGLMFFLNALLTDGKPRTVLLNTYYATWILKQWTTKT